MLHSRLLTGIAAAFAGMTVLLFIVGVVYSPLVLVVAALFGGVTYVLWTHGTGRLPAHIYRRVQQQAAANAGGGSQRRRASRTRGRRASDGGERGGFGAGPREEWRGPRAEQRARQQRRQRQRRQRDQRRTAPSTTDKPSATAAYETLGLDPGADESEVKSAYRQKVKDVHPDTEGGDEEAFKEVNRAYERLTE